MRNVRRAQLSARTPDALSIAPLLSDALAMGVTPEFRRHRARLAANTRHHPERIDDDRQLLNAASREQKLRQLFGSPPPGMTWIDQIRSVVDDWPPLTPEQREKLALLLQPVPGSRGGT